MRDIKQHIQSYIPKAELMQLATSSDNMPWVCSLLYISDEHANIYWISLPDTKHSLQIHKNAHSAVTIVASDNKKVGYIGVQLQGVSTRVEDREHVHRLAQQYEKHFKRGGQWLRDFHAGENPHVFYQFTPKIFEIFDAQHFPEDPKQTLK